jgi:hypothetical protein
MTQVAFAGNMRDDNMRDGNNSAAAAQPKSDFMEAPEVTCDYWLHEAPKGSTRAGQRVTRAARLQYHQMLWLRATDGLKRYAAVERCEAPAVFYRERK